MESVVTIPCTDYDTYPVRILIALRMRPEWARSLTLKGNRVTFSDNPKFGGTIAENIAYCQRHGFNEFNPQAVRGEHYA